MQPKMSPHPKAPPRTVVANLDIIPFAAPPGALAWVACAACSEPLGLHQPDPQAPDRLLGICQACNGWFLIEMLPEPAEAMMILLPKSDWLRKAVDSHASGSSSVKPQP